MQISKKEWPLLSLCGIKTRIDTQPDYQRPAVWSFSLKQLLVDTILRSYDVPKIYWRQTGKKPDTYEVVDGQQRIRAIWEYHEGKYALPKKSDPIDGLEIEGLKYDDLPDDLRLRFDTYNVNVVIVSDTDEDEVREMFLRLQNGTTLKAQERRNAMPGKMRDFVKALAEHPFFASCNFANARYTFDQLAAQMTLIELIGEPTNIKNADLNKMYQREENFDSSSPKAKKIRRTLDYLLTAFPNKAPELERYSVISLYILVSHLLERYVVQNMHQQLADWFIGFESYRRDQRELDVDKCDPEIVQYQEKTSHSTDSEDSVQWRHAYLLRKFLETHPSLQLKDDQRLFTHDQRMAIFRRDRGVCQVHLKCAGQECSWDGWEADHKHPWSQGGKTTVQNGQVACLACNASKGGILQPAA
jgi:Protein of unknown function DUF262/HNH endonuclease